MKLPKTTEAKPYIEFRFTKQGKLKLSTGSGWWGGKNAGFSSSDGSEGNTCKPKDLKTYIKAFVNNKIKKQEKEIATLQKQLQKRIEQSEKLDTILSKIPDQH